LDKITDLPAEIRNKHSTELLKMVCNCIEASIDNKDKSNKMKIDKKLVCVQIYSTLFGNITPADLEVIAKNIEYLHDNNQIIKYSFWKVATATAWNWIKSKL
jgi:translation initiation factor 2B subunit (eIF-2B alpha/beta/delta family)